MLLPSLMYFILLSNNQKQILVRLSLLFGVVISFDYLLIRENRGPELPNMLQAVVPSCP